MKQFLFLLTTLFVAFTFFSCERQIDKVLTKESEEIVDKEQIKEEERSAGKTEKTQKEDKKRIKIVEETVGNHDDTIKKIIQESKSAAVIKKIIDDNSTDIMNAGKELSNLGGKEVYKNAKRAVALITKSIEITGSTKPIRTRNDYLNRGLALVKLGYVSEGERDKQIAMEIDKSLKKDKIE